MRLLPFRRRITLWSTLAAVVSIVICGAGAAWFIYQRELVELDDDLRVQSDHFFSEIERHGGARFDWSRIEHELHEWLPASASFIEIHTGADLRWRSTNLAAPGFEGAARGISQTRIAGESARLLSIERDGITFAIAGRLNNAEATARGLVRGLLAALPVALAFAWLGGRRIAALAVAPVTEMTAAAERVTAERLDQRVPVPPVDDEIQRLARVLNATFDRLERSYQQALRFSADASHELNTPLTVMRASIEAVLDSPSLGGNDRAAIASLIEQTRRLSDITASLLLLSRADAGRLILDFAEADLAVEVEACAEDARIVAEQRGVSFECETPAKAPARVDALRFAQIVSNLFDNAVKYNSAGGRVTARLEECSGVWRLLIGNTGPIISPEQTARLFERFFRADQSPERPGHGLGLSLARELARAHGGDVTLVRSDHAWTEFAFTTPQISPSLRA